MERMNRRTRVRLWQLMWWSLRLNWSRNKMKRRRARQKIAAMLEARWRWLANESPTVPESAVVRALWLGAALAARSAMRSSELSRIKRLLVLLLRLMGKNNSRALLAAYFAWVWLWEAACGSGAVTSPMQNQG
ncbi:MAG: hypothetical protein C7B46_06180 [Sulfobacillus benefaciens]|uniref:Uncharacterized protein n=1 Tax=Sulfobacillus benefaciens TaxID=453960 RepID=A0A2T2XII1_9FIRM|nr:MAG: hypothetical protein C7B46_06180 [Sulfobacillus benefaciens]